MAIVPIMSQGADSNCYLIIDDKTLLIDPGAGLDDRIAREVDSELDGRSLDIIVNTHAHFDHCVGNHRLQGAQVHIHRDDAQELLRGSFYGTYQFFDEEHPIRFHKLLVERDKIDLGEHVLKVIHTPGHTPGGICLFEEDEGILFSGDTLFPDGGFGRLDMGGDQRQMIHSLDRITKLDFDILYPGHGPAVSDGKKHAEASLQNAKIFTS
ncbi:MAG: MBL fold metallo-hydrolase [Candidatus Hydrothermarchaeales archaeon]